MSQFTVVENSSAKWDIVDDPNNKENSLKRYQQECDVTIVNSMFTYTILSSKIFRSEGHGSAQGWHMDVQQKIATEHNVFLFTGNMHPSESYILYIGTSMVTIKPRRWCRNVGRCLPRWAGQRTSEAVMHASLVETIAQRERKIDNKE